MAVRAKFKCTKIEQTHYNRLPHPENKGEPCKQVTLEAVYDESLVDQSYSVATPTGSLTFMVTNPAAHSQFEIGTSYFIDITPAE